MNIKSLQLHIQNFSEASFVVVRAEINDGIGKIPSILVEAEVTSSSTTSVLQRIAALRGSTASLHAQDTKGYLREYAGVIHNIEAKLDTNGVVSYMHLHLSGWPRTPKSHTKGYRFFQDKTAVEVASEIFTHGDSKVDFFKGSHSVEKRAYQVQYGESDQAFVSRLLLREQLLFWVETLPVAKDVGLRAKLHLVRDLSELPSDPDGIEYTPAHAQAVGVKTGIYDASAHHHTAPDVLSVASYSTKEPNVDLRVTTPSTDKGDGQWIHVECNDFWGDKTKGESKVNREFRARRAPRYTLSCDLLRISVGTQYSVTGLLSQSIGTKLAVVAARQVFKKVLSTTRSWSLEGRFKAVLPSDPFTPPVPPAPVLPGLLRGVVVSRKDGKLDPVHPQYGNDDTVHTDGYGRIRVRLLWHGVGRAGEDPASDAPWLRVMTPWAGNRAGFFALPRAGQEVMVSFINGDAEQPVVMGAVYGDSESSPSAPPWGVRSAPNAPKPENTKWVGLGTRSKEGFSQFLRLDATDPSKGNDGVELYSASRMRIDAANNIELAGVNITIGETGDAKANVAGADRSKIDVSKKESSKDAVDKGGVEGGGSDIKSATKSTKTISFNAETLYLNSGLGTHASAPSDWKFNERVKTQTRYSTAYTGHAEILCGAQAALYGTTQTTHGVSNGAHGFYTFAYAVGVSLCGLQNTHTIRSNAQFLSKNETAVVETKNSLVQENTSEVAIESTAASISNSRILCASRDLTFIL